MYDQINNLVLKADNIVWGLPLIILLLSLGTFLTFRLKLLQVFHLPKALKYMLKDEEGGEGEVSTFGALCTALSATIGTGNIVGVATAVVAGGPGALFWMMVSAFLGMTTKYAEGLLAIKYRSVDEKGHVLGGPFYYIEHGLGKNWKPLAKMFAFFGMFAGLFGTGTFSQISGITSAVKAVFDPDTTKVVTFLGRNYSICVLVTGLLITVCAALVIIGGLKRISSFSEIVIPFMAITYVVTCLLLLILNASAIPHAFYVIFKGAFNPSAITGGAIGSIIVVAQKGIARGIFSNEAGLGSAPIAAAAARSNEPVRQGLVSMTGNFFTIIICTMTGLCIVITDAWCKTGLEAAEITSYAFKHGLPFPAVVSATILMLCLSFFAFTTITGWNYYSARCAEYLSNGNKTFVKVFNGLYIAALFVGPYLTADLLWNCADVFNGLMALPNLIAIFFLSGVVVSETNSFFERLKSKAGK
ncbi:MAG: alanine:cation symporter family protein [Lachnospiraceae bacterium]|nr:alanine:cation symporter family protein [Lachnospiraceae bacterium]